ncbi:MAG TPA: chromosome segregation protein SMC [Acidimicrobiales bacterium]|nr:chromosome segregation protein SMC [Acidimicrobiales bacterium]
MFLKTLVLKGFKSFADTTTLEFEPGITVVVGPNGSGKSNIVDAVAWVLGAQGPRTVRSGKMEDVIFAGTAKRPALGRAEVSLTIDNSAGLIPIDFTEVTITRTLWRSGESEYAINGAPCRLLDIQELLSDSGVGRQQHVIVSQGQLDAVLNAQPVDRRLIIEEAAGVLKYRRRREKAQRRLDATEGDLLRVQDLLREVRRQLRPLERQADAARRHGDVVAELRALQLFGAGRELGTLRNRASSAAGARASFADAERRLVGELTGLDSDVVLAEAALTAAEGGAGQRPRRDVLADHVARAEGLRERARGLAALVSERARSIERLQSVQVDADLATSLQAESAELDAALTAVDEDAAQLAPALAALAEEEAAAREERSALDEPSDAADGPPGAGAAEVRGELSALRSAVERARAERDRIDERRSVLAAKVLRLAAESASAGRELEAADEEAPALAAAAAASSSALVAAEAAVEEAELAFDAATGQAREWRARAEALAAALDEARARAGASRLAGLDGLVGTIFELVSVEEGWEAAFEAAVGEAAAAVLVDGPDAARAALARLHDGGAGGAVLALGAHHHGTAALPQIAGAAPVRGHVRTALPAVAQLLDRLLAGVVAVEGGWPAALDVAMAHPDVTVVTRGGDRFGPSGWRAGAGSAVATGSALDEARRRAAAAEEALTAATATRGAARDAVTRARREEGDAGRRFAGNGHARAQAAAALERAERARRDLEDEVAAVAAQRAELAVRLDHDEARIAVLDELLPALEAEEAEGHARAAALRAARGRVEQREAGLRARRTELEVRAAGLEQRRAVLDQRRRDVEARLGRHLHEREGAGARSADLVRHARAVARLGDVLVARLAQVDGVLGRVREERQAHATRTAALSGRLEELRRRRAATERELGATRERLQRAELEEAETRVRIEAAVDAMRRELDCEPDTALAAECPPLPPGTTADQRTRELERELRLMGPINPLAVEEHAALVERHEFLEAQLEDVKAGRRELAKVIKAIDTEIVEVFSAAYADVAGNFAQLFATLFPGGSGGMRLTDPDDLLETGIEIEARPSGKNVKRLSLLSGGERSLTAMAFLFAVFRSRPSPFYLMDEVEAALDDVNLHRFLDLVDEFRNEAQLLIVSHQKRTMEAADCLYGVTMQPGGSSRVISERVAAGA